MRQRARIVAVIGEFVSTGMPEHMRMNREGQLRSLPSPLEHPQEPSRGHWCAGLGDEHVWALVL